MGKREVLITRFTAATSLTPENVTVGCASIRGRDPAGRPGYRLPLVLLELAPGFGRGLSFCLEAEYIPGAGAP